VIRWFLWTPWATSVVGLLTVGCASDDTGSTSDSPNTGGGAGEAATGSGAGGSSAGGTSVNGGAGGVTGSAGGTPCDPTQTCREGFCSSWEAPVSLQPEPGPTCRWLDLAMNDDGFAVLAWYESLDRGQNVWASLYTPEMGWADAEPLEAAYGEPDADNPPSVAVNQDGAAMVVWDSFDDEYAPSLWSARHEVGSSWEAGELIDPDDVLADTSRLCQVALAPSGDAVLVCGLYLSAANSNLYTEAQGWGIPELVGTS